MSDPVAADEHRYTVIARYDAYGDGWSESESFATLEEAEATYSVRVADWVYRDIYLIEGRILKEERT